MAQVFLIIITALGAIYALFTKQGKIALGLLTMSIAFVFAVPDLVSGIWTNVFGAITMVLFLVGVIIVVYKKKTTKETLPEKTSEGTDETETKEK